MPEENDPSTLNEVVSYNRRCAASRGELRQEVSYVESRYIKR